MADKAMETKVKEVKDSSGNIVERITELWMEKVPMELKSRVVEKISNTPIVLEKTIENYEDGQVVDSKRESLDGIALADDHASFTSTVSKPVEKFKGLTDMQGRVSGVSKKVVLDVVFYLVITGLLVYITFKAF